MSGDFDVIAIDGKACQRMLGLLWPLLIKTTPGSALDLAGAAKTGDFESQPHITGSPAKLYDDYRTRFAETDSEAGASDSP